MIPIDRRIFRRFCPWLSLAALTSFALLAHPARAEKVGPWGAIANLRDDTNTHTASKPAGGWYVTPIHAVLRARDGKVTVTGTKRIGQNNCNGSTTRNYGVSFVLNPADLDAGADGATLLVRPIDEKPKDPRQVLYCSGQIPLADGRIFYAAGTDYPRALPISNPEIGLDYARIFDPATDTFTRIDTPMKGGPPESPGMKWYPSNRLLPDGRVLMMGGYTWSQGGAGGKDNRSLEIFDPAVFDRDPSADPYTVLTQPGDVPGTINAAGRAYTHFYLFPKPVPAAKGGGMARTIALMGSQGDMWQANHEPGATAAGRMRKMPRGTLPNPSGADKAEGSTSVMLPDGRVVIMSGGRDGPGSAVAHFYDPYNDAWENLDLGIGREFPIATWLPDGTVLLLNGYTSEVGSPWALTNAPGGADGPRRPQIIDPFKKTVMTLDPWPETTPRGYHSWALLLKDGRIMIGGGKDNSHDTGCEKNEARIYSPPYLSAGARPQITNIQEGKQIPVGGASFTIQFSGSVRADRGVVLMAPGAVTHSYNQNQRYLPLSVVSPPANGMITVAPPATINEAPPGEYILHVISAEGAPSAGVYVRVVGPPACVYPVDASAGVFIEAEGSSRRAGPFKQVGLTGRGNDAFIEVDPAATAATDVPDEGNVMWYDLDVRTAATAYLWLLGNGPNTSSNTVFVSINGSADQVVTLSPAAWGWTKATTALTLPAGKQTLKIKAAKPGAQLDKIWLTGDANAAAPNGLGGAAPDVPCSKGQPQQGGTGGSSGAGGAGGAGGSSGTGGTSGAGGSSRTGGSSGTAGTSGTGGAGTVGTGGAPGGSGGAASTAGSGGTTAGSGGTSGGGGGAGGTMVTPNDSGSGCGCRLGSPRSGAEPLALFAILSWLWVSVVRRASRTQRGR
jgi:hypothetical protein